MSAREPRIVERYNRLKDRERLAVFVAGVVVILGLGFLLAIDGALMRQKGLQQSVEGQQRELAQLQAQNADLARSLGRDPDATSRERIAKLRAELDAFDAELRDMQRGLVAPERMVRLLEGMLAGNSRVRLVSLKTLPVTSLVEPVNQVAAGGNGSMPVEQRQLVYKHGIELTVEGSYLDLVEYQTRLEKLPWQMFWARSRLDASRYPEVRLTLTLYTLSLDKAWLIV